MLYGSQARGNPRVDSDTDVLQLVVGDPRAYSVGSVNVTQYRPRTIKNMARSGSLFIFHLKMEGVILDDPTGVLVDCLADYSPPADYSPMLADIADAARALDPDIPAEAKIAGLCRLGVYLLRTTLYVQAIQRGIRSFDLERILAEMGDVELARALSFRHLPVGSFTRDQLFALHAQLAKRLNLGICNPYGTLEGLAIALAPNSRIAPLIENLLIGRESIDYSTLSFPPF